MNGSVILHDHYEVGENKPKFHILTKEETAWRENLWSNSSGHLPEYYLCMHDRKDPKPRQRTMKNN